MMMADRIVVFLVAPSHNKTQAMPPPPIVRLMWLAMELCSGAATALSRRRWRFGKANETEGSESGVRIFNRRRAPRDSFSGLVRLLGCSFARLLPNAPDVPALSLPFRARTSGSKTAATLANARCFSRSNSIDLVCSRRAGATLAAVSLYKRLAVAEIAQITARCRPHFNHKYCALKRKACAIRLLRFPLSAGNIWRMPKGALYNERQI